MSKESDNKAIVGRWFTNFWGETCDLNIVDELAAPDMLLQYSPQLVRKCISLGRQCFASKTARSSKRSV